MLTSQNELASIIGCENLLLIDARSFPEYEKGHIPGAVNLPLFSYHWADSSAAGIKHFTEHAAKIMSAAGVDSAKKVVFYDDSSGMLAARGAWLLTYLSHHGASMLDGGLAQWKARGGMLEQGSNPYIPSQFDWRPDHSLIAGYEHVRDNLHRAVILDARSPGEYAGAVLRAARGGHIKGAINVNWEDNLDENGAFKDAEELSKMYDIDKNAEIITYCQGAYRAANAFIVLKMLGFSNVRVYLGSWAEWGSMSGLPADSAD